MLNTKNTEVNVSTLPSITFEEMKEIYEGADFIDIIFYNVDFSMSVNNKTNIQKMVGFVSTNVATINRNCKPMGRLFFQKNGELMVEADMFAQLIHFTYSMTLYAPNTCVAKTALFFGFQPTAVPTKR